MSETTPPTNEPLRRLRERLTQLEESQTFSERNNDAFQDQLQSLERRLQEAITRVARLEARLAQLGEQSDEEPVDDE